MPFKRILDELVSSTPGAQGAILADWEGEAVEQAARMDDYELRVLGAHKGIILGQLRDVLTRLNDQLQEIVISSERARTLVLPVTDEYFLVVVLDRDSLLGPALAASRNALMLLKNEIV